MSIAYTFEELNKLALELRKGVKESGKYLFCRIKDKRVLVTNRGASLQVTFEIPNLAGGSDPSITTRQMAL